MGFIYEAMDKAKEQIAKNLEGEEKYYKEIWEIIDEKWDFQLYQHLHAAAYYLNPRIQYSDNPSNYPKIKLEKADLQLDEFRQKKGFFGFRQAQASYMKRDPSKMIGGPNLEMPELASFAVRVLSLTCSYSGCERNWSTHNQVHTKRKNRLPAQKINSLVYIMFNKKLKDQHLKKKKALQPDEDPLIIDELPSNDEWIAGNENKGEIQMEEAIDNLDIDLFEDGEGTSTSTRARKGSKKKRTCKETVQEDEEEEWIDCDSDTDSQEFMDNERFKLADASLSSDDD
ncbi:uncharacterized protein LOC112092838 [Morus notabilis]|uniref:uncharacterized protein LOC112092838 n=1 Tax=Morus notabilis TaxID=981085 RepID=UPI000CECEA72|nr:uncharacterized protein LOC112092838 [Morus notabilis]